MSAWVTIMGGGPASCAAVVALHRRGLPARLTVGTEDQRPPPLVLNEAAVELLVDVSGGSAWLGDAHQLRRRVVRWGSEAARAVLEPAISLPGAMLRQRLGETARRHLGSHDILDDGSDAPSTVEGWSLFAEAGAAPAETTVERFGGRVMLSSELPLARTADSATCWMEANRAGWVFLAPITDRRAIVQAALPQPPSGDAAEALAAVVASTRDICRLVEPGEGEVHVHFTAPTRRRPLAGLRWLVIGHAAISLDPICGDGTAQSLRTGLLAAAIIAACEDGGESRALIEHYERRVARTFAAHLDACAWLYDPVVFGREWERETAAVREGARALERERLAALEYSLTGGRLVPIDTKDRDPAGRMKADSLLNFDFEGTEKEIRIGDKCG